MDPDSDLDPAIFVIDLQDANKNNFFKKFRLNTFGRYIYIILKDKMSKRSHKAVIKVFLTIFVW